MLSIHAIDRALQSKDYDRLLRDLGRNGLVMPLPLRVQLAETPAGARGLGLRRLIELTYGPTELTRELVRKLIRAQVPGGVAAGSAGDGLGRGAAGTPEGAVPDGAGRGSCLLTAAFAAGLGRALRDHAGRLGESEAEIAGAYDRALSALSAMQRGDGLFATPQDRTEDDRLLTSAFIAYLLIDAPRFAEACRGHELLSALEDRLDVCDAHTEQLINMARLSRLVRVSAGVSPGRASAGGAGAAEAADGAKASEASEASEASGAVGDRVPAAHASGGHASAGHAPSDRAAGLSAPLTTGLLGMR